LEAVLARPAVTAPAHPAFLLRLCGRRRSARLRASDSGDGEDGEEGQGGQDESARHGGSLDGSSILGVARAVFCEEVCRSAEEGQASRMQSMGPLPSLRTTTSSSVTSSTVDGTSLVTPPSTTMSTKRPNWSITSSGSDSARS